jgi:hypothetical protein
LVGAVSVVLALVSASAAVGLGAGAGTTDAWVFVPACPASLLTLSCGNASALCCVLLRLPSVNPGMGAGGVAGGAAGAGAVAVLVADSCAGRASAWRSISASAWAFLVAVVTSDQVALPRTGTPS